MNRPTQPSGVERALGLLHMLDQHKSASLQNRMQEMLMQQHSDPSSPTNYGNVSRMLEAIAMLAPQMAPMGENSGATQRSLMQAYGLPGGEQAVNDPQQRLRELLMKNDPSGRGAALIQQLLGAQPQPQ